MDLKISSVCEISLEVPVELVRNTVGISVDFGGSLLKIVYRSKKNKKEAETKRDGEVGHLELLTFQNEDLEEALKYVRDQADIRRSGDQQLQPMHTTGYGCTVYGSQISKALSLKLCPVAEFECFASAFSYLSSKLSRAELLKPACTKSAKEEVEIVLEQMKSMQAMTAGQTVHSFVPSDFMGQYIGDSIGPLADAEDIHPCLLAQIGSANVYYKINKDQTWTMVDSTNRGGRTFYEVGRFMTDCKNYDELLELAAKGDPKNIDFHISDLNAAIAGRVDGDDSCYSKAADSTKYDGVIICFGKCENKQKEDHKREDLARAWLKNVVLDLVQTVQLICLSNGIKRAFFCGSFCNSEFVQELITIEFAKRNIGHYMNLGLMCVGATPVKINTDNVIGFDFIKHGSHLGAIGALIENMK